MSISSISYHYRDMMKTQTQTNIWQLIWKERLCQLLFVWFDDIYGSISKRTNCFPLCEWGIRSSRHTNIQLSHETLYYNNNYRVLFRFTVSIRPPTYSMLTKRSHQCHWHDEIHTQNELRQHQLSRACWLFTTYKLYTLLFS